MPLPDERLERIVFVTERFGELRGLVCASTGAFLILGVITWTLLPGEIRNVFQNVAFLAGMATIWSMGGIEAYYERWYGRAPMRASSHPGDPRPVMPDTVGAQTMQLAIMCDLLRGFMYPGGGSIAAAGLVGYSIWVMVRDWRYRSHYVVALAAGIAGIVVTWSVPLGFRVNGHSDAAIAVPYVVNYALIGMALVFVGVLDHRLLAQAMRPALEVSSTVQTVPDCVASRVRAIMSGTSLLAVLAFLAIAGWPTEFHWLYWVLYMTLVSLGLAIQMYGHKDVRARIRRAEEERARLRQERLALKVAALRGEVTEDSAVEPLPPPSPPPFDAAGHMILPIAMAAGALSDVLLRGAGLPSLLALALGLSHLRIALRDWPSRQYYLLGAVAASSSAIHFIFVTPPQILDWAVWFVILTSSAMLVEGLLDLRLARTARPDNFSRERHADAI